MGGPGRWTVGGLPPVSQEFDSRVERSVIGVKALRSLGFGGGRAQLSFRCCWRACSNVKTPGREMDWFDPRLGC